MQNKTNLTENLIDRATDYVETKMELLKLQAVNTTTEVASTIISRFVVGLVIGLLVLILSAGFAIWLGDISGKLYYGFFLVSAFYLLVALVLYFFRDKLIKRPFTDMLIKKMLN